MRPSPILLPEPFPQFQQARSLLLDMFPLSQAEGIDTMRVEGYLSEQGLRTAPYVIVEESQIPFFLVTPWVSKALGSFILDDDTHGIYIWLLDLVAVFRRRDYEALNGALFTEWVLVHEQAHASHLFRKQKLQFMPSGQTQLSVPRSGFALQGSVDKSGIFLEEGWADIHRGEYLARYATPNFTTDLVRAAEVSGLHFDFTPHLEDKVLLDIPKTGETVEIPLKYAYINPSNRGIAFNQSAFSASALELLIRKHPALRDSLFEARNSAEGLRQFARLVEKVDHGLYMRLRGYTESEFHFGLADVMRTTSKKVDQLTNLGGGLI